MHRLPEAGSVWRAMACLAWCAVWLVGCDKSPAAPPHVTPGGFDPAGLDSGLAIVSGVPGTPVMQSLTALSPLLIPAAAASAARAATSALACGPVADRLIVGSSATIPVAAVAAMATGGLIADTLYRRVFVYDTAAKAYRASTDTSGPQNGIRYVLYDVSAYGLPTVPLTPDGWLDLTDESAGTVLQLRTQISNGTSGVADFLVGLSGTQAADTALLAGTVTDGTHTLSFRDSTGGGKAGATLATRVAVSAQLSDSLDGFSVKMLASRTQFDPFDYDDTLDFTFASATQTVRMAGAITTYCLLPSIGLTVSLNDTAYATITNGTTTPNVTLAGGQPATADQAQALLDMKDAQTRLFVWLGALFGPAKALLP
jgi:hypothetical protein